MKYYILLILHMANTLYILKKKMIEEMQFKLPKLMGPPVF